MSLLNWPKTVDEKAAFNKISRVMLDTMQHTRVSKAMVTPLSEQDLRIVEDVTFDAVALAIADAEPHERGLLARALTRCFMTELSPIGADLKGDN